MTRFYGLLTVVIAAATVSAGCALAESKYKLVSFDDLLGWEADDHAAAMATFSDSCADISAREWAPLCGMAATKPAAKPFFEAFFAPVVIRPNATALFTGYFEPELDGSLTKTSRFKYPIYKKPQKFAPKDPELTRQAIDDGALEGRGLEIAYVDDPVEAYFLHIQGSGRIKLQSGEYIRVGYAGENGHVYRSAPGELVRLGEVRASAASIGGLRNWVKRNPEKGRAALQFNASYVFFRTHKVTRESQGPQGALDRPITAMRSLAVDPRFVQLGAPVWIEKGGRHALRRLMVAQDVGSKIKGPQRADIFFGSGEEAGRKAGRTKDSGRMVVLLPIAIAHRLVPDE